MNNNTTVRELSAYLFDSVAKYTDIIFYSYSVIEKEFIVFQSSLTELPETLFLNKEILLKDLLRFIERDNLHIFSDFIKKVLKGWNGTIEIKLKSVEQTLLNNSQTQFVLLSCFPVILHDKCIRIDGIIKNITEEKSIHEKLLELEQNNTEVKNLLAKEREDLFVKSYHLDEIEKLKNEFISNVSHEFRTPLASIIGFAETIDYDDEMPQDTRKEFNKIILTEAKRLANLINHILDFAKIEQGTVEFNFEKIDLNKIAVAVLLNSIDKCTKKNISTEVIQSETPLTVLGDYKWIELIFENIIGNSIKFTNRNGKISLSAQSNGTYAEVILSDTGIGIPEIDLPHIFQKFFKGSRFTNEPGTGIGLPLAKRIIEQHNGEIEIQSKENIGTIVSIKIPLIKHE